MEPAPGVGGILPDQWPEADSLTSLEEIYKELCRIDVLDGMISRKRAMEPPISYEFIISRESIEDNNNNTSSPAQVEVMSAPPWFKAAQQVDNQRTALRAKAMSLSRPSLASRNILDLPEELLVQIFGHLKYHDRPREDKTHLWWTHERTKTNLAVRRARQVCRTFNELASPHLCQRLAIELSRESLDRAEGLVGNRLIVRGIQGIQVIIQFRPAELARDLGLFVQVRKEDLGLAEDELRANDYGSREEWEIEDEIYYEGEKRWDQAVVRQTLARYEFMLKAWNKHLGITDGEECEDDQRFPAEETVKWQKMLWDAHREYARLHEEQLRLIQDRTFANTVATLASRLGRPIALRISDSLEYFAPWNHGWEPSVLADPEELAQFLVAPHTWERLEQVGAPLAFAQGKIISELPMAMHNAGVQVQHLSIGCLPCQSGFSSICPGDDESPEAAAWDDLRTACQQLQSVELGGTMLQFAPGRLDHVPAESSVYIEKYLNALLRGRQLRHIDVGLRAYGVHDQGSSREHQCYMGGAFANVDWPRANDVRIRDVRMSQEVLEGVCRALGPAAESCTLESVNLTDGRWAPSLDILRDKLAARSLEGRCETSLVRPLGGEFGQLVYEPTRLFEPAHWKLEDEEMAELAVKYVKGEVMENPVLGREIL